MLPLPPCRNQRFAAEAQTQPCSPGPYAAAANAGAGAGARGGGEGRGTEPQWVMVHPLLVWEQVGSALGDGGSGGVVGAVLEAGMLGVGRMVGRWMCRVLLGALGGWEGREEQEGEGWGGGLKESDSRSGSEGEGAWGPEMRGRWGRGLKGEKRSRRSHRHTHPADPGWSSTLFYFILFLWPESQSSAAALPC